MNSRTFLEVLVLAAVLTSPCAMAAGVVIYRLGRRDERQTQRPTRPTTTPAPPTVDDRTQVLPRVPSPADQTPTAVMPLRQNWGEPW